MANSNVERHATEGFMKTSSFTPAPPSPGPSSGDHRRAASASAIRIVRSVRTAAVAIAFTLVGVVASCVIELTHGRRGW
jgi:hypothetical protein